MKKLLSLLFLLCIEFTLAQAQSINLPNECQRILATDFRSWKLSDVPDEIKNYYKRERAYEQPNLIKGDWNGDGKTDYAILLEKKTVLEKELFLFC